MEAPHLQSPTRPLAPRAPAQPKPSAGPTWTPEPDPSGFDDLPSASAERNGGNGKAAATAHNDRPFKDQGSAVQWACRFPHYRKDDKPDIPHAVGSLKKLCADLGCSDREVDCWADAWMDHVASKAAATMEPTHAELDAQAAAQS
jgi:hypothetical protein